MTSASPGDPGSGGGVPRDRRASNRAAVEIPAVMHVGTREIGCSIRDLSVQGVALNLKESVAPGMVVRVAFRLPNARQPVEVSGVLVRTVGGQGNTTLGLQFLEPDADSVRVIETFVARNRSDQPFSRQRAAGPDSARVETGESAASLRGLYQSAVEDVVEKKRKRRGLFDRWRRRGES